MTENELGQGGGGSDPGAATPVASVVVPHFDDLRSLDLCLTDLERQTYPRADFEIIVADNASPAGPDALAAVIRGRARLVTVMQKGAGPARNGGAAVARGRVLGFTDCDCRPQPGWLSAGLAALSGCDIAGGRMQVSVEDSGHMTPTEAFEAVFAFNNLRYVTRKGFTVTANLFCGKDIFDAVGGFRVGLSEDIEWCQRATQMGYTLGYAADAAVSHPARRTWADLLKKWRRTNREAYELYTSRRGGLLIYLVRSALMPVSALPHTATVLLSKNVPTLDQKWAAVGVLFRLRFWRFADSLRLVLSSGGA